MGLRSAVRTRASAFWASWADCGFGGRQPQTTDRRGRIRPPFGACFVPWRSPSHAGTGRFRTWNSETRTAARSFVTGRPARGGADNEKAMLSSQSGPGAEWLSQPPLPASVVGLRLTCSGCCFCAAPVSPSLLSLVPVAVAVRPSRSVRQSWSVGEVGFCSGSTNVMVRDMDVRVPDVQDGRRLEVVVEGVPMFGGAQLAWTPPPFPPCIAMDPPDLTQPMSMEWRLSPRGGGRNSRTLISWVPAAGTGLWFSLVKWVDGGLPRPRRSLDCWPRPERGRRFPS